MSTTTLEQGIRIPEVLPESASDVASPLGERSLAGSGITVASEIVVDRSTLTPNVELPIPADEEETKHILSARKIRANFESRRQESWQEAQRDLSATVAPTAKTETSLETMLPERGVDGYIKWSATPHIMLAQVAAVRARELESETAPDDAPDAIRYNADGIRIWPSSPHEVIAANQEALRISQGNARQQQ